MNRKTNHLNCTKCYHNEALDPLGRCTEVLRDAGGSLVYCGCKCEWLTCDVCGKIAIGVCSSAFGAVSYATCQKCVEAGIEPYEHLVGGLCGIESMEDVATWAKPYVIAILLYFNKTEEQLFSDIKANDREFEDYMSKQESSGTDIA